MNVKFLRSYLHLSYIKPVAVSKLKEIIINMFLYRIRNSAPVGLAPVGLAPEIMNKIRSSSPRISIR